MSTMTMYIVLCLIFLAAAQPQSHEGGHLVCDCHASNGNNETVHWDRSMDQPVSDSKKEGESCMCGSISGVVVSAQRRDHGKGSRDGKVEKDGHESGAKKEKQGRDYGTDTRHGTRGKGSSGSRDPHGRDGSKSSQDKEDHESSADKKRGSERTKGEMDKKHVGEDSEGQKEGRESGANSEEEAHEWGTDTRHVAQGQAAETEAREFGTTGDIRHTDFGTRHDGQSSNSGSSSVGAAEQDEKERLAEDNMTGSRSTKIFIGASVAGGVLATLVVAACWRWRTSFCCSSSKTKSSQLEPAANTVVVGVVASDQKKPEAFQEGSTVVVGVCIDSEADLELGTDKPNRK